MIQTDIILFRHPSAFATGPISQATWQFPGAHLTASTSQFYANLLYPRKLLYARWLIAWNPNGNGTNNSGARLICADSGPANIFELARIERNTGTPRVDGINVTVALQTLLDAKVQKTIGYQSYGNGTKGADFSLSMIELIWENENA